MDKILIICGPTSTGKTGLALKLAEKFNGELVSADSRQVYKGMDIGTGKDLPKKFKFQNSNLKFKQMKIGCYVYNEFKIWGYDLINPKENFSVAQFIRVGRLVVGDIWQRNKLPILVGGTGLYIKGIIDGIATSEVSQDSKLRTSLNSKNADELFEILAVNDPIKAAEMNVSDRKNPRRLIRAIEISKQKQEKIGFLVNDSNCIDESWNNNNFSALYIGLSADKVELVKRIEKRVRQRINRGFENEISELLESGVTWNMQSMHALGYKQWREYYENKISKQDVINKWIIAETKYIKRQTTWFKTDKRINWFDISEGNWKQEVEKSVKKWQNE
jgi:tRNA dimethylallyltransferase